MGVFQGISQKIQISFYYKFDESEFQNRKTNFEMKTSREKFKTLPNACDGAVSKNSYPVSAINCFRKSFHLPV